MAGCSGSDKISTNTAMAVLISQLRVVFSSTAAKQIARKSEVTRKQSVHDLSFRLFSQLCTTGEEKTDASFVRHHSHVTTTSAISIVHAIPTPKAKQWTKAAQ
eukprot:SAG31_NODE_33815_length_339_cov_2.583333_1_plen_102_part_01